jgi:protein TonB
VSSVSEPTTAPAQSASASAGSAALPASVPIIPVAATVTNASTGKIGDKSQESKKENKQEVATPLWSAASSPNTPLPGEKSAIILSSKGAEKRLAHTVAPKYPIEAGLGNGQGTVVLKTVVDENGAVAGVRVVDGKPTLATAAVQAVSQWRYRPYIRNGKPQSFQTIVIVDFQRP